jgi:hypothetical protein
MSKVFSSVEMKLPCQTMAVIIIQSTARMDTANTGVEAFVHFCEL